MRTSGRCADEHAPVRRGSRATTARAGVHRRTPQSRKPVPPRRAATGRSTAECPTHRLARPSLCGAGRPPERCSLCRRPQATTAKAAARRHPLQDSQPTRRSRRPPLRRRATTGRSTVQDRAHRLSRRSFCGAGRPPEHRPARRRPRAVTARAGTRRQTSPGHEPVRRSRTPPPRRRPTPESPAHRIPHVSRAQRPTPESPSPTGPARFGPARGAVPPPPGPTLNV